MKSTLDEYCGSQFWNTSQTWNTPDPDLTICFEKTVLVWIPCIFLWLFSSLEAYYISNSKNGDIAWNWLNTSKLLVTALLIILSATDLFVSISNKIVYNVDIYTPIIKILSFVLYAIFVYFERKYGLHTSEMLFRFWLLLVICGVFQFQTEIRAINQESHYSYISYLIYYPLVVLMFLLNCFADKSPRETFYQKTKKPCPEETASSFSKLLFFWTFPLILKGAKKPLEQDDLWDVRPKLACRELASAFDRQWEKELLKVQRTSPISVTNESFEGDSTKVEFSNVIKSKKKEVSVFFVLSRAFGPSCVNLLLIKLMLDIIVFVYPLILKWLIGFAKEDYQWKGYFYTALLFFTSIFETIINAQYMKRICVLGIKLRSSLVAAIYKKTLKISNIERKDRTAGEIVNLMSVDANTFRQIPHQFVTMLFAPFEILVAMYFLWNILGPSILAGLAVMILLIPLNAYIVNIEKKLHVRLMKNRDDRVKIMNELLNGIKVLKLYGWEPSFENHVLNVRNKEIKVLKKSAFLSSIMFFIWICAPFMVSLATFATYVLVDEKNILDVETAFVSIALFAIMRTPLSLLPTLLNSMIQAAVSMKRINTFLNAEDLNPNNVTHDQSESNSIIIENGTFTWGESPILKNINICIEKKSLTAVVGSVGSGKSSLLSAILGEMDKQNGRVNTVGSIAYVPQQAWIQNATLRDNILFGKPFDKLLYDKVISSCALTPDIEMLPAGDQTEIGEKGINLSGGQKQRVSLARAVYADRDIYFLDDPLSAVDSHVGKHIFDQIIGSNGLLKNKTTILVTHSILYLSQTDNILVLKNGEISESGTYQQLLDKKGAFSDFLIKYLNETEEHEAGMDEIKNQLTTNESVEQLNKLLQRHVSRVSESLSEDKVASIDKIGKNIIETEKSETGSVDWVVYKHYLKLAGLFTVVSTVVYNILFECFSIGSNVWLTVWSTDNTLLVNNVTNVAKRDMYIGVYGALGIGEGLVVCFGSLIITLGLLNASKIEHAKLLHCCVRWPLSFFDTTPLGRILNRFSSDVIVLDDSLPEVIQQFIQSFFGVIKTIAVISFTTPIFIAVVIPISVLYYVLQKIFIASSRQLKRLESVSESPIYSHFGETITGVLSIRAYNRESRFICGSHEKVDNNLVCLYSTIMTNIWTIVTLEFLGSIVILFAALFAVINNKDNPGLIGLSVTYALQITGMLNWVVRLKVDVENNIVSVERIKEYCDLEQEAPWYIPNKNLPKLWPEFGVVEFKNYSVRYRPGLDLVLKNINFTIKGGEKVGIVGRTGAGKSSLTMSLFRILEAAGGVITIDNVNISEIGLHTLRSCLTIIPQDAVLFSGSLRMNLDPFDEHSDDDIWQALEHSHLHTFVKDLPAGLNHEVTEGGDNLSSGQKQLICLSRALLRKTKLLVLDEATASVDLETDDFIQKTIRTEFKDCTVLTIAHRLNTIMDSDRVIVLDKGELVEFDTSQNLLKQPQTIFFGMCKEAGLV